MPLDQRCELGLLTRTPRCKRSLHMARGLLAHAPIDWALAVTGIAGPSGGSQDKPVGLVWLALVHAGSAPKVWHELFSGDRHAVRIATLRSGFMALCEALEDKDL